MAKFPTVTPDELRRAFIASNMAFKARYEALPGDDSEDTSIRDALSGQFPPEKIGPLLMRLVLITMWLKPGEDDPLVAQGTSAFDLPEIHPAVFDVAASCPMPSNGGLPSPTRFMKDVERRVRMYETLAG
ncbi:MAG: hypothetical protein KF730_05485 [Sphingomonas sp.]|uniref:hypothetical protein n=1 Tax=Sphingomonas sp. TaxID=28214 RepID=UPI0025CCD952|nr:hypothetical protein [Sphingomonas sp.]MBX3564014.1 hypothetical protein [Sphingomonas sp.]